MPISSKFLASSAVALVLLSPAACRDQPHHDDELTAQQVQNLALLGKVWGFAKYHHPRITGGGVDWDQELLVALPSVYDASDSGSALQAIERWLDRLGHPDPCDPCAEIPGNVQLAPDLDWIHDRDALGELLSQRLELMYERRSADSGQSYIALQQGAGNPEFRNEAAYADRQLPEMEYRLLALFRYWNIIEYWFPYRDVIGEDWDDVLVEFLPRMTGIETRDEYILRLIEFSARINDTHANLWGHLDVQPPRGSSKLPVVLRFVEDQVVVTGYSHPDLGPATELRVGDVVEEIDGVPVDSLVSTLRPFYPASNEPRRMHEIAGSLTRGDSGAVRVSGTRATGQFALSPDRVLTSSLDQAAGHTHDLPGPTFRWLSPEVAYLKLSSVVSADVGELIAEAADAEVLIVDIRNYPSEFVVFELGGRLVTEPARFARFTIPSPSNPGLFTWLMTVALEPLEPYFANAVVILIDETSLSQAEYTAMALRAAPNAVVVGSTTAGADGNVSSITLPGDVKAMISGIGVFYPDGTPTQRIGIVPDLEVHPTIEGIRANRDEVLEAGVSHVLGREFSLSER